MLIGSFVKFGEGDHDGYGNQVAQVVCASRD